ncbi:MAG: hypothetical protein ACO1NP_00180 [Flavobacterium sp.]
MLKILFFLFPVFVYGQSYVVKKDSIIITIKLKITEKRKFIDDSLYVCDKSRVRIRKDTLYYYAKNQYLKLKK